MKRTFIKLFVGAAVLTGGLSSCDKFLDIKADNIITFETVFNNKIRVEEWLASVYWWVEDTYSDYTAARGFALLGDEITANQQLGDLEMWAIQTISGNWSPTSDYRGNFNIWSETYKAVRAAYQFIDNVYPLPDQQLTEALVEQYKKEARFLIAYHYFRLLTLHGPFPLVKGLFQSTASQAEMTMERTPLNEIIEWLDGEFTALGSDTEEGLPIRNSQKSELGRPTRGTALAYRAQVRLWAASPLFNGNPDYKRYKNPSGSYIFDQGPENDPSKWEAAREAFEDFWEFNEANNAYELYITRNNDGTVDAMTSLTNLFLYDDANTEQIWFRPAPFRDDPNRYERLCMPRGQGGFGCLAITKQCIDRFFMDNGLPIDAEGSGYKDSGFSTEDYYVKGETSWNFGNEAGTPGMVADAGTFNQFIGREPRFYVAVKWHRRWMKGSNIPRHRTNYALNGGDGPGGTFDYPPTGMQPHKRVTPDANPGDWGTSMNRPSMILRLGEMYLQYAEVLAECGKDMPKIKELVNAIRERAGIPLYGEGPDALPEPSSFDEWKEKIRMEQNAELALEGIQYFNYRRWKIAHIEYAKQLVGWDVMVDGSMPANNQDGDFPNKEAFYKETTAHTIPRVWPKKFYLWPIHQNFIDNNPNLVQNPGWSDTFE